MGKKISEANKESFLKQNIDQHTKMINKNGLGKTYIEFSRQKYNKYRHQYPRMRESELVQKIINEWEALPSQSKNELFHHYFESNNFEDDESSNSDSESESNYQDLYSCREKLIDEIKNELSNKEIMTEEEKKNCIKKLIKEKLEKILNVKKFGNKFQFARYESSIIQEFVTKSEVPKSSVRPFDESEFQLQKERDDYLAVPKPNQLIEITIEDSENEEIGKPASRYLRKNHVVRSHNNFFKDLVVNFITNQKKIMEPHGRYEKIDLKEFDENMEYRLKFMDPSYYFIEKSQQSRRGYFMTSKYTCCKCGSIFATDKYPAHYRKCMSHIYFCINALSFIVLGEDESFHLTIYIHFLGSKETSVRDRTIIWSGTSPSFHQQKLKEHIERYGINFHAVRFSRTSVSYCDLTRSQSKKNKTEAEIKLSEQITNRFMEKQVTKEPKSHRIFKKIGFNYFHKYKKFREIEAFFTKFDFYYRPLKFKKNMWLKSTNNNFMLMLYIISNLSKMRKDSIEKKDMNHYLKDLLFIQFGPNYRFDSECFASQSIPSVPKWSNEFLGDLIETSEGYAVLNEFQFIPSTEKKLETILCKEHIDNLLKKVLNNFEFVQKVLTAKFEKELNETYNHFESLQNSGFNIIYCFDVSKIVSDSPDFEVPEELKVENEVDVDAIMSEFFDSEPKMMTKTDADIIYEEYFNSESSNSRR